MTVESLRQFARELLQYGEQMYLERCAAIAVLEVLDIPERRNLFAKSVELFENKVHAQFQPLLQRLESVIAESETQDTLEELLKRLPKGLPN